MSDYAKDANPNPYSNQGRPAALLGGYNQQQNIRRYTPQEWEAVQGVQQSNAKVPQTPMANIAHRLGSAVDEAARLAERLSMLECRVTGGGNPIGKDHPTQPHPIPVGHIGQMGSSLDDLADRMNRAAESVSRLLDVI